MTSLWEAQRHAPAIPFKILQIYFRRQPPWLATQLPWYNGTYCLLPAPSHLTHVRHCCCILQCQPDADTQTLCDQLLSQLLQGLQQQIGDHRPHRASMRSVQVKGSGVTHTQESMQTVSLPSKCTHMLNEFICFTVLLYSHRSQLLLTLRLVPVLHIAADHDLDPLTSPVS